MTASGRSVGYAGLPADWDRRDAAGSGPFVTRETFVAPDGAEVA